MIRHVGLLLAAPWLLSTAAACCAEAQGDSANSRSGDSGYRFPPIREHYLSNGLRVLVVEEHTLPLVAVRLVIHADELLDPPGKEGLYAITLAALRDGTTGMDAAALNRATAQIGTPIAPTGFTTMAARFPRALELLAEMVTRPSFDSNAVERRKALQAAAFRQNLQRPAVAPRNLFYTLLYGVDDPLVRAYRASDTSALSITRADVVRCYQALVTPANSAIIVVGDVTEHAALAAVTHALGSWHGGKAEQPAQAYRPPVRGKTTIFLHDVPGQSAYVYLGSVGPARDTADAFSMEMMGTIANARFVAALRQRRSFMYSGATGVVWRHSPRTSEFFGSTNISGIKVDSALVEWLAMLRGLGGSNPVTAQELDAARQQRIGLFAARVEGVDSIAKRVVDLARDNLGLSYYSRYVPQMSAVTTAGVARAVTKYINTDSLVVVVTGDRRVLEPALRAAAIAPLVVVDDTGHPVP